MANSEAKKRGNRRYAKSKKGKLANEKYAQSKKGKEADKKGSKKYYQTSKGKTAAKKKQAKRKRNFGWTLMFPNPFDDSILVDYHHVTDVYVVAVPRDLHELYNGKYHREKMMVIVKQIYLQRD